MHLAQKIVLFGTGKAISLTNLRNIFDTTQTRGIFCSLFQFASHTSRLDLPAFGWNIEHSVFVKYSPVRLFNANRHSQLFSSISIANYSQKSQFGVDLTLVDSTCSMPDKKPFERLPANVVPSNYAITLKPDLKAFTFEGSEVISVKVGILTLTMTTIITMTNEYFS